MKLLMLAAVCIFSVGAFTQVTDNKNYKSPDTLRSFKGNSGDALPKQPGENLNSKKPQNDLFINMQGNVAILKQDKMPCVVPDTSGLSKMPNAWGTTSIPYFLQRGAIPNPALPRRQSSELKIPGNTLSDQSE